MTREFVKYWIIGGEYNDTSFERLVDGTESLSGPFGSYDRALAEWRKLAEQTRCNAHHRYIIAHEPAPIRYPAGGQSAAMATAS